MFYWHIIFIKVNALNLRTPIDTMPCNKFTCIRTVTFLDKFINDRVEKLFPTREVFNMYWVLNKVNTLVLIILEK